MVEICPGQRAWTLNGYKHENMYKQNLLWTESLAMPEAVPENGVSETWMYMDT